MYILLYKVIIIMSSYLKLFLLIELKGKSSGHYDYKHPFLLIKKKSFLKHQAKTDLALWTLSSLQLLSHVRLFATPWNAACQASLSIANSWSLLKLMSIESVMLSNHLILCRPLLLLPSIFPSIRVFSNESVLHIRWSKYWSFSFGMSPSNEYLGPIFFRMDWLDLLAVQGTLKHIEFLRYGALEGA